MRRGLAVLVALVATVAIGALSQVPYHVEDEEQAWIRLSWRVRTERIEECRKLTAEEIAELPVHMRREEVCERRGVPYRLRVTLDGNQVEDGLMRGAGARGDRPIFVYRELRTTPGLHRVEISFEPEHEDADQRSDGDLPSALRLATELDLAAGDIALITRPEGQAGLVVRRTAP